MAEVPMACAVYDIVEHISTLAAAVGAARHRAPRIFALLEALSLQFGPVQLDLHSLEALTRAAAPEHGSAEHADPAHTATARLLAFCTDHVRRLDREYPESDLTRFASRMAVPGHAG
jgi:hypothetical protein